MWKTQSTFPHGFPHLVENFIIVENSVGNVEKFSPKVVEKWGCGKFWGKLCGNPLKFSTMIVESFVEKSFPQLPVENLVD
jgi:hypothetical protein